MCTPLKRFRMLPEDFTLKETSHICVLSNFIRDSLPLCEGGPNVVHLGKEHPLFCSRGEML